MQKLTFDEYIIDARKRDWIGGAKELMEQRKRFTVELWRISFGKQDIDALVRDFDYAYRVTLVDNELVHAVFGPQRDIEAEFPKG